MKRPAIGITIGYDDRRAGLHALREDYVKSVEQASGLPLVLAPGKPGDAAELLAKVDALVLSGGSDIDPALYGETPHAKLGTVVRQRDDFELAMTREALALDRPILAICRGHQVLNVACGGTLVQDIPSEVIGGSDHDARSERWERAHDVRILQGTRLRAILGRETVAVNSFHHQAVGQLGRGLAVSAYSAGDQVVEAIEMPMKRFVVGVQWHPESFWNRPDGFGRLFEALVAAAVLS
ncbi:MAG: gamma-glutamyl-gamma-aminobutyrate hydrolase family protein [Vicinamibacteria bacterium]